MTKEEKDLISYGNEILQVAAEKLEWAEEMCLTEVLDWEQVLDTGNPVKAVAVFKKLGLTY